MGNPNRLPEEHPETFEGRLNDPRLDSTIDPTKDSRFDTHQRAGAVPPSNLSAATRLLVLVLGVVLMVLLIWMLLYWRFQTPLPRSPEDPQSQVAPTMFSAHFAVSV